jgi:hypothetical protein
LTPGLPFNHQKNHLNHLNTGQVLKRFTEHQTGIQMLEAFKLPLFCWRSKTELVLRWMALNKLLNTRSCKEIFLLYKQLPENKKKMGK